MISVFFSRRAEALLATDNKIGDSDDYKNADNGDYHQNLDQGEAVFVNFLQIMASSYSVTTTRHQCELTDLKQLKLKKWLWKRNGQPGFESGEYNGIVQCSADMEIIKGGGLPPL
jgi:hypothetical protein